MRPPGCYTITEVAAALDTSPRQVRGLIERGHVHAEQPYGHASHRYIAHHELRRLERRGLRVNWRELRALREPDARTDTPA